MSKWYNRVEGGHYKFVTSSQVVVSISKFLGDWEAESVSDSSVRISVKDGSVSVSRGYAWDGITGGFNTEKTMEASLVHDILYQSIRNGFPIGRKKSDTVFREILKKNGFFLRSIYYGVVRVVGWSFCKRDSESSLNFYINTYP